MPRARSRTLPVLLALATWLAAAAPVLATDPPSAAEADAPAPPAPPSVHFEMLSEHADDEIAFTPGGVPPALSAPAVGPRAGGVGTVTLEGESAGVAALPNQLSHEVFGYLPYWMLTPSALANLRYDLVSSIAYFGVPVRKDGTLAFDLVQGAGWNSAEMTGVIANAHARGVRVVMTVTMMAWDGDYANMTALLTSDANRAKLVNAIAAAVKARSADGVNVDFEPVPESLRSPFTAFIRELKAGLQSAGAGSYLTVATMAGAAAWASGYDVAALAATGAADALMVMAYDFHYAGSARAGGVAPYESPHIFAARDALVAYLGKVPAGKIIWGVPYYGRAWTTTTSALNATTTGEASWAPRYTDALEAASDHGRLWDATGRVPWYRYFSSTYDSWVQGYYDDATSLKSKYALVRDNGLRGAGIWHLLMDGSRTELWDTIYTQFGPLPFTDISGSKFAMAIVWLAQTGITAGCTPTRFCPTGAVTRAQMASFLARFLELPEATTDFFDDDDGSVHEANINRLAAAGITAGCAPRQFCPDGIVLRDQMASFLSRALHLPATTTDVFDDDHGSVHETNINRLAAAGITAGCAPDRFCPKGWVVREQVAAFLQRASRL